MEISLSIIFQTRFLQTRRWLFLNYPLVCIYRRPNTNVRVFISEFTSFIEEKVLLFKNLLIGSRYQCFYAAIKWCVKKLDFFLHKFGLLQQVIVPTQKKWWNIRPSYYIRGGWSFRTSSKFRCKLWLWSFALWSSAKTRKFSCKEGLIQKMAKCWRVSVCRNYTCLFKDNPENFWNSGLMNEISYVDNNHPLKNQICEKSYVLFLWRWSKNDERIEKKVWKNLAKEW